ncbi:MAG: alkaline phosphatase family protein [Saprospiraceae bacterium]|nr:alkaline phosphatase family protein [Saprospiraceae bacterium]
MKRIAVINVVGLSSRFLGPNMPFLSQWIERRKRVSIIEPVLPAVTCTAQSTYLTGKYPNEHGIIANGWYFREECEAKFWRQSNRLVQSPKIWEIAKERYEDFTCANMFWWYNMYSSVDYCVTPRPQYRANGLKIPDCYSFPLVLRHRLQKELGSFPLFSFWGPNTNIKSSEWISKASQLVHDWYKPSMMLIYLPHLDYNLQRFGPSHPSIKKDLLEIDNVLKDLIGFMEDKEVNVTVLSGYGITDVQQPIHLNRLLRKNGYLNIRIENGLELIDFGTSRAFVLADHQIAHIYVKHDKDIAAVKSLLEQVNGIDLLLVGENKKKYHLNHYRSGEIVAIADQKSWFTYYYWLDDKVAPDFARTVDIHKKPGYDPVELFMDPKKKFILPRVALKLIKKKLGFRYLMDIIPLDAKLVKGSHGQVNLSDLDKPIYISNIDTPQKIKAVEVFDYILESIDNG